MYVLMWPWAESLAMPRASEVEMLPGYAPFGKVDCLGFIIPSDGADYSRVMGFVWGLLESRAYSSRLRTSGSSKRRIS